ncbi:MAG: NAD(P)H-hydrate epimerase [Thermoplasmata archaeon]
MNPARLTAREAEVIEANAVARGVGREELMEAAGRAVAEEAGRRLPPPPARVAVLAGPGNNGGDGFVAARRLAASGYRPELWRLRPVAHIRPGPAARAYGRLRGRLPIHSGAPPAETLTRFPLVIDAMLGTGQTGPLRPPYLEAARELRKSGVAVLSVDVPTGLGGADAVRPEATVTFTAAKVPMTQANSGALIVRDIGIPAEAIEETGPGEYLTYPFTASTPRGVRIVVVGGGPYAGAPALTALAALRAGAERATVLCPAAILHDVRAHSPTLVAHAVGTDHFRPRDAPELLRQLRSGPVDAVALGMGAGRDAATVACLNALLRGLPPQLPVVVDADGLEAACALPNLPRRPALLLTPNHGELLRLLAEGRSLSDSDRPAALRRLARRHHVTILSKGDPDRIDDGSR